jgi:transcriptional regulator
MKRRDLLTGTALAAGGARGERGTDETLYVPQAQRVDDRELLHAFMDEYAFADLITTAPALRVTHIPVLLDRKAGANGTLYGHIARNNPQSEALDGRQAAVMVFHGPHSYISPGWYGKPEGVPTWNFAVVHASGKPSPIREKKAVREMLARLIGKFEERYGNGTYDFGKLSDGSIAGMLGGVTAFAMRIEALEGKFKLGQERSAADRAGILAHLGEAKAETPMREFTARFYERLAKGQPENGPE